MVTANKDLSESTGLYKQCQHLPGHVSELRTPAYLLRLGHHLGPSGPDWVQLIDLDICGHAFLATSQAFDV